MSQSVQAGSLAGLARNAIERLVARLTCRSKIGNAATVSLRVSPRSGRLKC